MLPLNESFHTLRARVEARITLPALVVVSGAQRGEGTTTVACGLARAFAADGHRTLLVDANAAHAAVADELGVLALPGLAPAAGDLGARNGEVPRLSLVALQDTNSREERQAGLLNETRERFTITIVDAGPLALCSTALHIVRSADAVVLAVRLGRRSGDNDREALQLCGERLIGVVPTRARSLRATALAKASNVQAALRAVVPTIGAVR
jgi:Mrp family chromosome partitioning ATPase